MSTSVQRMTYDERNAFPQERPGDRHELINGELIVIHSATPRHQGVGGNLLLMLGEHVRAQKSGEIYPGPIDIRLTPHIVLIPDIIYVDRERLHVVGPRTVDAAPDLVVEVLSPDTRERDLGVKRELYARFGVQEYWIADPDVRSLAIQTLQRDRFKPVPAGEDGRLFSPRFPELKLDLDQIFDLGW